MGSTFLRDHPHVQQCLDTGNPEAIAPFFFERWLQSRVPLEEYTGIIDLLHELGRAEDAYNACCRALEIWPGMPALTRRFEELTKQSVSEPNTPHPSEVLARLTTASRILPAVQQLADSTCKCNTLKVE